MQANIWAVVLSWNGREDTLRCLETLARQTLKPGTVLVVDNGSTDGLQPALAKRFPEARYLRNPENLGYGGGINAGLRLALKEGAEYILTPNNDTLLDPRCLELLAHTLASQPEAAAVSPRIFFDYEKQWLYFNGGAFTRATLNPVHRGGPRPRITPAEQQALGVRTCGFLNACCPLFRASALRRVGLYQPAYFVYYEDGDLSLRLRKAGYRLFIDPRAEVIHKHAASTAGQPTTGGKVSPFLWHIMTRNRLWLLRRHGAWWQKLLGITFIAASRSVLMGLQVLRGRPQKAAAVLKGLLEGMFTPLHPTFSKQGESL